MADLDQVERLKDGLKEWNEWRDENPKIRIDLSKANLKEATLWGANLSTANLEEADLRRTDLTRVNFREANLRRARLRGSYIQEVDLRRASLYEADFREVDLGKANLVGTVMNGTDLKRANLGQAIMGGTVLVNLDLSEVEELEEVRHEFPSRISTDTIQFFKGNIPEKFLRGCGLTDWEIESAKLYQPGLSAKEVNDIVYRIYDLRANQVIQINPLFISYCHGDSTFVDEMEKLLNQKGIRFWRDIHDASAGRLEKVVDRAIRQNPIVLLILSENSVKSDWVEHEARTARDLEKELKRDVLCPVALDDAWKDCKWPARLREQIMEYHILDFSKWKDEREFAKMFRKLVDGLDLFYKG
jgi:hypothetical protein